MVLIWLSGTGGFFIRHGLGAGCEGLGWARSPGSSLGGGDGGSNAGGGGRGGWAPAASELVGDLGSFLLLGSIHLSLDSTTLPSLLQLKASPVPGWPGGLARPLIVPGPRWQPQIARAGGASGLARLGAIYPASLSPPGTWPGAGMAGTVSLAAGSGTPGAW